MQIARGVNSAGNHAGSCDPMRAFALQAHQQTKISDPAVCTPPTLAPKLLAVATPLLAFGLQPLVGSRGGRLLGPCCSTTLETSMPCRSYCSSISRTWGLRAISRADPWTDGSSTCTHAPSCSRIARTDAALLNNTARWSGENPVSVFASTLAPALRSSVTAPAMSLSAAMCSGVLPIALGALTSAPLLSAQASKGRS